MVNGQVGMEAIIAIAGEDAGLNHSCRGGIDLCPADAVYRTAAWVTGDGHGCPGKAVAVFKVERTPVTGIQGAAA